MLPAGALPAAHRRVPPPGIYDGLHTLTVTARFLSLWFPGCAPPSHLWLQLVVDGQDHGGPFLATVSKGGIISGGLECMGAFKGAYIIAFERFELADGGHDGRSERRGGGGGRWLMRVLNLLANRSGDTDIFTQYAVLRHFWPGGGPSALSVQLVVDGAPIGGPHTLPIIRDKWLSIAPFREHIRQLPGSCITTFFKVGEAAIKLHVASALVAAGSRRSQ